MNDLDLSIEIEARLVARNPRQMQTARAALPPGYLLRAAQHLHRASGSIIIGTGFPVTGTFETDGPVGAIALYQTLTALGAQPIIACGPPLSRTLATQFDILELTATGANESFDFAVSQLRKIKPEAVISIERPGLAADGRYYNMRGIDISDQCYCFDPFLTEADCATIGIGDGGNEIGMGNIAGALQSVEITPSVTVCDELVVADVSNWGAYGLIALLAQWQGRDLLAEINPQHTLEFLSSHGSVDGVTGENTLTEDGLEMAVGLELIDSLRTLLNFTSN